MFGWLRRWARQHCRIGAIGLGSFLLARAGLLDGYRCTIHWQHLAAFREEFRELEVTNEIFEIDRDRFTCGGGIGALDVMLAIIAEQHGRALATRVAEELIHERIRTSDDDQRMPLRFRLNTANRSLLETVALMERNLEQPLSCGALSKRAGLSVRQLESCSGRTSRTRPVITISSLGCGMRRGCPSDEQPILEVGIARRLLLSLTFL